MRQNKVNVAGERATTLRELKLAVVDGTLWRYDYLLAHALAAGASDEEIDRVASTTINGLLTGAELPLTARELAHDWIGGHFRA